MPERSGRPMASRCALRAGRRRPAAGGPSASSPGAASTSRNISKRCRICAGAAMRWLSSTGGGRGIPRGGWAIRGRAMSRVFRSTQIDVAAFVKQVVLPDCPPPYFAMAHSMGGAVMLHVAHAGLEVFERFVLCAPMIDLPPPRASLPMRGLMRSLRAAGMGERFIPGGNIDLIKSTGFPGNPLTSDPRRYARNASSWRPIRRSGLRRRRWPGSTRSLPRWASFVRLNLPSGFASRC